MNFDLIRVWKEKIPKRIWLCFWTGMISGWITHFYMLTNKLTNWDDVHNIDSYGGGADFGRWMLEFIHGYAGEYSVPAIHGMIMIICLAISSCLIVDMLHLQSETAAVMVPLIMMTFPSVGCTLTFMFTAHTYGLAVLLMTGAVWLLRKYRFGWIPCFFMLLCGLGIYQSYICIAIVLMLIGLLMDLIEGAKNKQTIQKGAICIAELLVSVMVYQKLVHVFFQDFSNEHYGGIDQMGQIAISEIPVLVGRCYKRFLEFFLWKPFSFANQTMQICNIAVCILCVGLGIYLFWNKKLYQDILKSVFYVVIAGLIPLGTAFIYLMAPEANYSMLMLYAYALIYVLLLVLWEQSTVRFRVLINQWKKGIAYTVTILVLGITLLSSYQNYLLINTAYFRTQIASERVKSYYTRLVAYIEANEEYKAGDKFQILGEFHYLDNPSYIEADVVDTERFRELSGIALENGLLTSGIRSEFLEIYLGVTEARLEPDEINVIMDSEEYKNMTCYPQDGCFKKINDVWILKICNNE